MKGHLVSHNKFRTKTMKALNIFGVTNGPLLVMNEQKHMTRSEIYYQSFIFLVLLSMK